MLAENFISEIFNIRESPDDYDELTLLSFISELIEKIKKDNKFANSLQSALEDKRLELGYCPKCGMPLVTGTYKEYHNELAELRNTPYELISYQFCEDCGYNMNHTE